MASSEKEFYEHLRKRIRQLRIDSLLSQQEVADALGIIRSTYAYYEVGRTHPKLYTLCRLARFYSLSLDEFLDFPKEPVDSCPSGEV